MSIWLECCTFTDVKKKHITKHESVCIRDWHTPVQESCQNVQ